MLQLLTFLTPDEGPRGVQIRTAFAWTGIPVQKPATSFGKPRLHHRLHLDQQRRHAGRVVDHQQAKHG